MLLEVLRERQLLNETDSVLQLSLKYQTDAVIVLLPTHCKEDNFLEAFCDVEAASWCVEVHAELADPFAGLDLAKQIA